MHLERNFGSYIQCNTNLWLVSTNWFSLEPVIAGVADTSLRVVPFSRNGGREKGVYVANNDSNAVYRLFSWEGIFAFAVSCFSCIAGVKEQNWTHGGVEYLLFFFTF